MQAAFVDIGLERNAFLYAGDILVNKSDFTFGTESEEVEIGSQNIRDIVKPGQYILVQVLKEPVGTKGARVTTHITLPGRTLVLMPTVNYIGVSRRIEDEDERIRLRGILDHIKPENMGAIVRTAALGKNEPELESDLIFLMRLWKRIQQKSGLVSSPRLIHAEEPLVFRTIRDIFTPDIDRLIINDREFFERIQVIANIISPGLTERVILQESFDLFGRYDLESKIEKALARKVWLKNGGYIVIDHTEALTSIDVNTGKFVGGDNLQETITETNCEAAKEIARQIRLRDMSGIIIVDFIDMDKISDKERLLETLNAELKKDRTKTNVLGITSLGLVEMTRKKMRQSIDNILQCPCPYCNGDSRILSDESVVLKIRNRLLKCFEEQTGPAYLVKAHPSVASLIDDNSAAYSPLLPRIPGKTVYLCSDPMLHIEEYSVEPVSGPVPANSKVYDV
jgi:ribonuclease G